MIRLLQTVCLAGVAVAIAACSESAPTAPQPAPTRSASRDLVGLNAPVSVSCTVTQLNQSQYEATATWSGLKVIGLQLLQGSTLLAESSFGHPIRRGSVTDTLSAAPDLLVLAGTPLGVKTPCSLVI